ncbi:hypothetical protein BMS3Bbin08_00070 [bacterium BMS3Bbin08]|nr:hypothetical protein BMS3Bbin08_00070 [bacterium BMS3Bbin08]
MDIEKLLKYTRGKTKVVTFKINPDLLDMLDKTIKKDKDIQSRSQLIERCILRYVSQKGKLK